MIRNEEIIPLSVPEIRGNEWTYVKECLDTGWVSSAGEYVNKFERIVADYIGCGYAVACVNGTAALHIALLIAGVKPDDEILMPAISFVAPANAVRYTGAYPVFIDVQSDIWQINPQKVEEFLKQECQYQDGKLINKKTKRCVRAILPVHILGHPVDMDPICALAERYNLVVIEDTAESMGAFYKDRKVGGIGDVGCFSFNGNKIVTAGGGGMIVTNNKGWADKARYLTTQAKDDPIESIHHEIGYNYRLTNIQAAIGMAQMECLEECIETKRKIAQRYCEGLTDVEGIILPKEEKWARSIYWLYTVLIDENQSGLTSRSLLKKFSEIRIQTRPLWCPLHHLRPFKDCYAHRIEVADDLYAQALSLPSSVGLEEGSQQKVINVIRGSINGYAG